RCRGGPPTVRASIVHDCLHTPPYVGPGRPFVNTGGYGGVGGKTAEAGEHLRAGDWEDAALEALGSSGLAAVNGQWLARTLGVTKGSFYWHFADREALLKATLARWEESYTERVIAALDAIAEPRRRLEQLLAGVTASKRAWRVHVALGAAAAS